MRFFLDFEATQPENEIISIGVVTETGATFHSLVKPQLSSISNYVSQLIHVTQKELEQASTIDEVLIQFDQWAMRQEPDLMKWDFISYGDDAKFVKATLPAIKSSYAFTVAAILMAKIQDYSNETQKFFKGPIRLINAFNYVQSMNIEQRHNPLEDAIMLQKVYEYIQTNHPLELHPTLQKTVANSSYTFPSGKFYCRVNTKNAKEQSFKSCEAAISWLVYNVMHVDDPESVHYARIANRIMKAIRTKTTYCDFYWRREKGE